MKKKNIESIKIGNQYKIRITVYWNKKEGVSSNGR